MRIFNVDSIGRTERGATTDQLLPEETIEEAFRTPNSTILFTDRRIIIMQVQNLLSERIETSSYSYRAMQQFSMIQGAPPESRSEVRIWLAADPQPLHLRANQGADLDPLHRLLARKML
jgi:hypothetical protein